MAKPLQGLKILDLTRVQQGPQATGLLCDLGAEVIKVESPGTGDGGRGAGRVDPSHDHGTLFLIYNRGKRDIAVDLKSPEGRKIITALIAKVDVIVSNFRVGVLDRLGLGYDAVRAINPRIVYAEANGLGAAGPRARLPVYDLIGQASSGLVSINGYEGDPINVRAYIADAGGAAMFSAAILAGVVAQKLSGESQRVEVSELGSMIALHGWELTYFEQTGTYPHPHPGSPSKFGVAGIFKTKDGHIAIANLGRKSGWPELAVGFGRPELGDDPRFATQEARSANREALQQIVREALGERTNAEWMERLVPLAVCLHPVQSCADVFQDEQALANGYVVDIDHPERGRLRTVGSPIKFGGKPLELANASPKLGEHTSEILAELGHSPAEIDGLITQGVVQSA